MTDRPIIFSAPMVRALLAGRKTQTRRLATSPLRRCDVGDRLYVREAFAIRGIYTDFVEVGYAAHRTASHTEYVEQIPVALVTDAKVTWPKDRPSIHMPRWASRLTLIVEGVKVERLHAISEADALAEGIDRIVFPEVGEWGWPQRKYRQLWDSLHTDEGERWHDNPDVVALTFRVVRGNIDQVPA